MINITYHGVQWCVLHGHPVLFLGLDEDTSGVGIAISVEDAQSLAGQLDANCSNRGQMYLLMEGTMRAFGIRIHDVTLRIGQNGMTDTLVRLEGPATSAMVPARLADGVALARRVDAPLRMTKNDADRIRATRADGHVVGDQASPAFGIHEHSATMPSPFRPFIESLDFDGVGDKLR